MNLPDSGIETQLAVLRGELQALRNECIYSAKTQGERLGQIEVQIATQASELRQIKTDVEVWKSRLNLIGAIAVVAISVFEVFR